MNMTQTVHRGLIYTLLVLCHRLRGRERESVVVCVCVMGGSECV